jgi:transposase-like protein
MIFMAGNRPKFLDERHYKAIEMLVAGEYTMQEIADEVGISRRQLYNWMNWDLFSNTLNKMIVNSSKNRLTEVLNAMVDAAVEDKSAAAAKLIFEAHELIGKKPEVNVNVNNGGVDYDAIKESLRQFRQAKQKKDK